MLNRISICLMIFCVSIGATFADSKPTNQKKYQAILAKHIPANGPGVAVIVSQNDDILYQGAFGQANLEHAIPLTVDSVFRLGSITKQFTAAAIMMLHEQKKLNIKDNIHQYIPDFPTEDNQVTIENLLTHTSGIANYTEDQELFSQEIQVPTNMEKMLLRFAKHPMVFKTGEAMRYSNTGYVLLGKIIEVASGQSYANFIEQQIFLKLGMKSSRYGGSQIIPNRASGYDMGHDGIVNASHIDMSWPHAAGSLLSTVGDLNIWFKGLRSGQLISKQSYQQMIAPFVLNDGEVSSYGYGLGLSKLNKYKTISHSGGIPGFVTNAIYLPEEDLYIAILANFSGTNLRLITNLLAAVTLDIELPTFKPIKFENSKIAPLTGNYRLDNEDIRKFFIENNKVYTQRGNGEKYEVIPMSDNSFYYSESLTYFVISHDNEGQQVMNFYSDLALEPQRAVKQ